MQISVINNTGICCRIPDFKGAVARNVRFQSLAVARAIKKNLNETFEDLAMCPANS